MTNRLGRELRKQAEYISKKQACSGGKRYMDAERDEADLMRCYRHVDALLQQLNINISLTVSRISHETLGVAKRGLDVASAGLDVTNETFRLISEHLPNAQLAEMSPVKEARYDSGATEVRRGGCTPNTRTAVLKDLVDWANDVNGPKVYWMNGMAGTGKTTIAYSFCERLDDTKQLAASFFCSRHLPGCRDPTRIVPTIAYQLARLFRPYHDTLCPAIINNPDIGTAHVKKQFKKLIWEPLRTMDKAVPPGCLVFVVDALDECSDPTRARYFADELLQCPPDSPIKFFITCRPDPILNDRLSTMRQASRSIFHLHNIEESLVRTDIETYLNGELQPIGATEGQVKLLAKRSGRLFIYAATVVRYIRPKATRVSSLDRLEFVLSTTPVSSSKIHESLDDLYGNIVSTALGNEELESWEVENIKLILYTVLCARELLSIETLAGLLGLKGTKEAEFAIEPLQSVLHVSDSHKLVTTLHASFPDYMHDQERSGRFWCDAGTYHGILAQRCFETTKKLLRFNICGLESSFVCDSDVPSLARRIKEAIPSHLVYACKHWGEHTL
ncbi:hypothetical protein FRC10_001026 [Ceratobasidium sp. 414]|nr:hypothetical protein FRC10_001026 [Ceratobasidium sp. 414]